MPRGGFLLPLSIHDFVPPHIRAFAAGRSFARRGMPAALFSVAKNGGCLRIRRFSPYFLQG